MKKILFSLSVIFLATIIIVSSCKKKEDPDPISNTVSITGTVYNQDNVVLAGVNITASGKTATTDANGTFSISGISKPSGKLAVYFKKSGFISVSRFETVSSTLSISVSMIDLSSGMAASTTFDASAGGYLNTSDGTSVNLPANSFKDASGNPFTGNVTINMAYIDPTLANYERLLDGSSQMLDDAGNQLESFGLLRVELMDDSGNPIVFQADSMYKGYANVGVTIPSSKQSTSPQEVTLYSFDSNKSAYVSSGATASKVGGQYVGSVSHFSSWNCAIKQQTIPTQGTMQYYLTGGQFQNQLFSVFDTKQAYYSIDTIQGNATRIYCSGTDGTISIILRMVQGVGEYSFDGANNTGFLFPASFSQINFQSGTVFINKYEQVGGLIEGTFNGICKLGTDTTNYTVSNGTFSITRTSK